MPDLIELKGLRVKGFHGVYPQERREGQVFVVDAELEVDTRAAARSDEVADTVHYGVLAEHLAAVVSGEPVRLIETLADRLVRTCLRDPRVLAARVRVHKPQAPIGETFEDVSVTVHRRREPADPEGLDDGQAEAVIALGANLGDRMATLQAAMEAIHALDGVAVLGASPVVETAPVGGPEQQDYLNAVLRVATSLTPQRLLASCHGIEAALGRARSVRWAPRTLDVDLITYGRTRQDDWPRLPHPRAAERAFVLLPWARLDPEAELVGIGSVRDLAEGAADRGGVRERDDLALVLPGARGGEDSGGPR